MDIRHLGFLAIQIQSAFELQSTGSCVRVLYHLYHCISLSVNSPEALPANSITRNSRELLWSISMHLVIFGCLSFEVKKGSKFNMNQKDLCLVPGFHENSILKHCLGEEHSSDTPFSAISRQRPTSSVAPYNFAHEAILAVDRLQNTRINHLENKSSTWMSKKDPVSTWVSIGNQSTLDLGDNFSYPHS